ncbi:hypothetical protein NKG05_22990 [Oerskovia sp. M15]
MPCYDGRRRAFALDEVRSEHARDEVRWFLTSNKGAVPGTQLAYKPTMPFRVRHVCQRQPQGYGAGGEEDRQGRSPALRTAGARVPGPPALPVRLSVGVGVGTHRAPGPGLCGAKVIGAMSPREAERLPTMPMCKECVVRYRRRHPGDVVRPAAQPS